MAPTILWGLSVRGAEIACLPAEQSGLDHGTDFMSRPLPTSPATKSGACFESVFDGAVRDCRIRHNRHVFAKESGRTLLAVKPADLKTHVNRTTRPDRRKTGDSGTYQWVSAASQLHVLSQPSGAAARRATFP